MPSETTGRNPLQPLAAGGIAGMILAGGASRRMGSDKSGLKIGDRTFLEVLAGRLATVCHPVVVVGRPDQADQVPSGCRFAADFVANAGPLAGLVTGLRALDGTAELVQVCPCDSPLFHPGVTSLLTRCINHPEGSGLPDAAIPWDGTFWFALNGLFRTSSLAPLESMFRAGHRRMQDLPGFLRIASVPLDSLRSVDPQLDTLLNANTPDELDRLLHRAPG